MSFQMRVAGHSLRVRVRRSITQEELGVEPLLLHIESSHLRWLRHLFASLGSCFRHVPLGGGLGEDPETMSVSWPGNALGLHGMGKLRGDLAV